MDNSPKAWFNDELMTKNLVIMCPRGSQSFVLNIKLKGKIK